MSDDWLSPENALLSEQLRTPPVVEKTATGDLVSVGCVIPEKYITAIPVSFDYDAYFAVSPVDSSSLSSVENKILAYLASSANLCDGLSCVRKPASDTANCVVRYNTVDGETSFSPSNVTDLSYAFGFYNKNQNSLLDATVSCQNNTLAGLPSTTTCRAVTGNVFINILTTFDVPKEAIQNHVLNTIKYGMVGGLFETSEVPGLNYLGVRPPPPTTIGGGDDSGSDKNDAGTNSNNNNSGTTPILSSSKSEDGLAPVGIALIALLAIAVVAAIAAFLLIKKRKNNRTRELEASDDLSLQKDEESNGLTDSYMSDEASPVKATPPSHMNNVPMRPEAPLQVNHLVVKKAGTNSVELIDSPVVSSGAAQDTRTTSKSAPAPKNEATSNTSGQNKNSNTANQTISDDEVDITRCLTCF